MIELNNINKSFGNLQVLKDIIAEERTMSVNFIDWNEE